MVFLVNSYRLPTNNQTSFQLRIVSFQYDVRPSLTWGRNKAIFSVLYLLQCADVEGASTPSTAVVGGPISHYYGKPSFFSQTLSHLYPDFDTADALCVFACQVLGGECDISCGQPAFTAHSTQQWALRQVSVTPLYIYCIQKSIEVYTASERRHELDAVTARDWLKHREVVKKR